MSQVMTQIANVIKQWVDQEENSYGSDSLFETLWMNKHGVAIKYNPDGISRLVNKIQHNQFFKNCPQAAILDDGFFVPGGKIQSVRNLENFLDDCSQSAINNVLG